jgi:hypothetical protein
MFKSLWQKREPLDTIDEDGESLLPATETSRNEKSPYRQSSFSIGKAVLVIMSYGLVASLGAWLGKSWRPNSAKFCGSLTSRYCTYHHRMDQSEPS